MPDRGVLDIDIEEGLGNKFFSDINRQIDAEEVGIGFPSSTAPPPKPPGPVSAETITVPTPAGSLPSTNFKITVPGAVPISSDFSSLEKAQSQGKASFSSFPGQRSHSEREEELPHGPPQGSNQGRPSQSKRYCWDKVPHPKPSAGQRAAREYQQNWFRQQANPGHPVLECPITGSIPYKWEQQLYCNAKAYATTAFNFIFDTLTDMTLRWDDAMYLYYKQCVCKYKSIIGNFPNAHEIVARLANLLHVFMEQKWRDVSSYKRVHQEQGRNWVDFTVPTAFGQHVPLRQQ